MSALIIPRSAGLFFHGGFPGLKVGDRILCPDESGTDMTLSQFVPEVKPEATYAMRRDVVYVTTERRDAELFARMYPGGGRVYTVRPDGPLQPDPDCNVPGMSWMCRAATIVAASEILALRPEDLA